MLPKEHYAVKNGTEILTEFEYLRITCCHFHYYKNKSLIVDRYKLCIKTFFPANANFLTNKIQHGKCPCKVGSPRLEAGRLRELDLGRVVELVS